MIVWAIGVHIQFQYQYTGDTYHHRCWDLLGRLQIDWPRWTASIACPIVLRRVCRIDTNPPTARLCYGRRMLQPKCTTGETQRSRVSDTCKTRDSDEKRHTQPPTVDISQILFCSRTNLTAAGSAPRALLCRAYAPRGRTSLLEFLVLHVFVLMHGQCLDKREMYVTDTCTMWNQLNSHSAPCDNERQIVAQYVFPKVRGYRKFQQHRKPCGTRSLCQLIAVTSNILQRIFRGWKRCGTLQCCLVCNATAMSILTIWIHVRHKRKIPVQQCTSRLNRPNCLRHI